MLILGIEGSKVKDMLSRERSTAAEGHILIY
jgi:hypothetical protein